MNEENPRWRRQDEVDIVIQDVTKISEDEVRAALRRIKNGNAMGPDDIPVEVWKCLGEMSVKLLNRLLNNTLTTEEMPREWRRSVLVPIFKNKGDVQNFSNYRGIRI